MVINTNFSVIDGYSFRLLIHESASPPPIMQMRLIVDQSPPMIMQMNSVEEVGEGRASKFKQVNRLAGPSGSPSPPVPPLNTPLNKQASK